MDAFTQIAIVVFVTLSLAFIAKLLKQPLIVSYIISGIIVGPYFFGLIEAFDIVEVFASMGIALLLFIVGIGLSPKVIREVGKVSIVTGLGQVLFTSIIGFMIGLGLGFDFLSAAYIAIALTFSSTIIIMKLVSDRGDTETTYGKIAIGFLIVQDIVVVFMLIIVSAIPAGGDVGMILLNTLFQGIVLVLATLLIGFKIIPKLTDTISESQELLLLFSLGWCFLVAAVFHVFNLSMEIGALLAGFTLASSPYRIEIGSKLRVMRDFFLVLFFIWLGSQLAFGNITQFIIPIIIFSTFILIGNPLIVITLMGLLGYKKRNGFMAGLTVAQISEFSIILIALGIRVGHLTGDILLIVTAVGLITITGSSYMILYADKVYPKFEKILSVFERKTNKKNEKDPEPEEYDCILFGCDRVGYDILRVLKKNNSRFFIVEHDPKKIRDFEKKGIRVVYGDSSDSGFLEELNLEKAKMIVSTVPDTDTNVLILKKLRKKNEKAIAIMVSYHADDAIELYDKGATYVIIPHFLGGNVVANMIEVHGTNLNRFLRERINHIKYLERRRKIVPEHFKKEEKKKNKKEK